MSETDNEQSRLRFEDFEFERFPDGQCRVRVELGWRGGQRFHGEATGVDTQEGQLRTGAEACLEAAEALPAGMTLELRGGKVVRAFDAWVIIVSIRGRVGDRTYQLLGSCATTEDDLARTAVLAVLDGTNRVVERHLREAVEES